MRKSGVLMHISSLPSPYGIGTLGAQARSFVDFLVSAGQHYWQMLPVSPTGYGDSPYQSFSSYAGNPYFIDLDTLCEQGYLNKDEYINLDWGSNRLKVDYGKMYENRFIVLELACKRLLESQTDDYNRFCMENSYWLENFALYMAIKNSKNGAPWTDWERELRFRDPAAIGAMRQQLEENISLQKTIQYFFYAQWEQLRLYANGHGVEIIGDIPMYAAMDSSDVWAYPKCFCLNEELMPNEVAGCPPDGFTADGQLWGNPLYDWEKLKENDYDWWIKRIDHQFKLYDVLRIDHFRGLDSFYAIAGDADNARNGRWCKGPGYDLFKALGPRRIIAEDLGFLTDSVRQLLAETGYPGMKVLQFAFDSREESDYLPHNFIPNCVAYTGTHDNSTILGWFSSAPAGDIAKATEYMRIAEDDNPVKIMLTTLCSSVAELAVVSMQDLLELDDEARMNIPGTLGGNWQWRMSPDAPMSVIAESLKRLTQLYGRI